MAKGALKRLRPTTCRKCGASSFAKRGTKCIQCGKTK